jgi:hypothetical protein
LPVKYEQFYGSVLNNSVNLNWITSQDSNNYFEVERSVDGNTFYKIGIVLDGIAKNNLKNYSFIDASPELMHQPIVYYRLKQFAYNGGTVYTRAIPIKLNVERGLVMQTSPNPFTENININFSGTENGIAEVTITDITGKKILTKQSSYIKGNNILRLNGLSKLAAGIYVIRVVNNGVVTGTQKMIKY